MPAERGAESTRRAVADAFRDLVKSEVPLAEQILCDSHSPGEQVFHRRQPDDAREAFEERRARQCARLREPRDSPRTRELAVHLPYRRRQPRIGQTSQQARRSILSWRRPQRLDEQHFNQATENEVACYPPFARFLTDEAH